MDYSTPGLPVHHQLPELTQIHVHWVGDAIQPSHPLSSPSPPAFNLSQHQGLFQWVKLNIQKTKIMASGPITSWQIDGETVETVRLYFGGLQNHYNGDCSIEMKRHLLLGWKAMTSLDCILKSRDITLPTEVCPVKAVVFPVIMYEYESWIIKKAEDWRTDAFELWCWRRLLRIPWTARRSNQSILKEISPE